MALGRADRGAVLILTAFYGLFCARVVVADDPRDVGPRLVLAGAGANESAPHGEGNVYAPDVIVADDRIRIWYGAQGRDGHDRIFQAESRDGRAWIRKGLALDRGGSNHVNDPSVVRVEKHYWMYYTRADNEVFDDIGLADSTDGLHWTSRGAVLKPGPAGAWDALLVGRPSVIRDRGRFRMWYDGRKDLPPGAPAAGAPTSPSSRRAVGYAESTDGLHWTKALTNPVFEHDAGGVDVVRIGAAYVMTYESHEGTRAATSADGLAWSDRGLWVPRSPGEGALDRHGHVTPRLVPHPDGSATLYFGAARAASWDHNCIARLEISPAKLDELLHKSAVRPAIPRSPQ